VKPLTVAFLGRSGSGKGTQAKMLIEYLGQDVVYIATGDLFRELSAKDSVIGRKVADQLKVGELPPDWLAIALWQQELVSKLTKDNQAILFDGALRRVSEIIVLDAILKWLKRPPVVPILIDVTRQEAFERLKLRKRSDDVSDQTINCRLDWYDKDVIKVVEYYQKTGRLKRVNGMLSPDKVFEELLKVLKLK
jgi:adenylate kinase